MIAMLFLLAAASEPGARIGATATAVILPGARIALAEQQVQTNSAQPQRTRIVRQEEGKARTLRLIEFQ